MSIDEKITDKITEIKPAMFLPGLFVNLGGVDNKETMKWILVKFLKETLDYLADPENKEKLKAMKRGEIIESWIDANLPSFDGDYERKK